MARVLDARLQRVANLPFDIFRNANAASDRLAIRSARRFDSIAIDIAIAMHDVPEMNSDPQFNSTLARDVVIALRERPLNLDRTLHRLEGAVELEQESVTDGFNLGAVKRGKISRNIRRCSSKQF